jgi:hypothetical protein
MYFERAGIENTAGTLDIAFAYAREKGIRDIVLASTTGHTAQMVLGDPRYPAFNIVIVTHNAGFREPGVQEFPAGLRDELTGHGIRVLTGTMVLRSLGTAMRELVGYSQQDLVANTLRMFSQGIKVCVEIAAMAADAGLVQPTDIVTVAGTGRGADTACVIKADSSNRFFNIKIREILVKPKEF